MLGIAPDRRTEEQAELAGAFFRTVDPEYLRRKAAGLDKEMAKNRPPPPSERALTIAERTEPHPAYVHLHGDYLSPGEPVAPGTPAFLPPLEERGRSPDRADLARWLVDPRTHLRPGWPPTASGRHCSGGDSSPHPRTSASRANRRRTPSSSTGWLPSSPPEAGAETPDPPDRHFGDVSPVVRVSRRARRARPGQHLARTAKPLPG